MCRSAWASAHCTHAGLALSPWVFGIAVGAGLSGAVLAPRLGRRVLHIGLLNAVQQYGGAVGVAVLGTVFFQLVPAHGFIDAFQGATAVSVGCFTLAFATVFLLPPRAPEASLHPTETGR